MDFESQLARCDYIGSSKKFRIFLYYVLFDLRLKKSEKFEFRKNFVTIFFTVKNWLKNWNFGFFFAYAIFEKSLN